VLVNLTVVSTKASAAVKVTFATNLYMYKRTQRKFILYDCTINLPDTC
jgi:hypothetical protein